eukprot:g3895.t1
MMQSQKPKKVTVRGLGVHVLANEARTHTFVEQWRGLMLKLAWVLGFAAVWSTYQRIESDGWGMTPALAFELFSVGVAFSTTMFVQSNGHRTSLQLCVALAFTQLFAYGSSMYNRRFPPSPSDPPMLLLGLVRDMKVLPDDAFPLGAFFFGLCVLARNTMRRQLLQARVTRRRFEMTMEPHAAAAAAAAKDVGSDLGEGKKEK